MPAILRFSQAPRNFVLYLVSRFCTATATTMLRSAISWHVFALTGSTLHLALIGFVQFIPAVGLSLVGGAVADSYDRRRIMMCAQGLALLCAAVLVWQTERGTITVLELYAAVFVVAVATAFDSPARAALLPS